MHHPAHHVVHHRVPKPTVYPPIICEHDDHLSSIDHTKLPDVPRQGEEVTCFAFSIHDGDSVHIIYRVGNTPVRTSIRVLGIDTPELHPGHITDPILKQAQQAAGEKARQFLASRIEKKLIKIHMVKPDKFGGRVDGFITDPETGENLSELMVKLGYGKPYNGEKKSEWTLEQLTSPPFNK